MYNPEIYVKLNELPRKENNDALNKFIKQMTWEPNETVLDIGCGPGDVTHDILYPLLMENNIQQLVGVDISKEMIDYAKKKYGAKIDFKVLDIENYDDCVSYKNTFNKIFSFICLNWVRNKDNAANNIYSMLKIDGEILIDFLLISPIINLFKYMDPEWQTYCQGVIKDTNFFLSREEIEEIFIKAGFKIIKTESNRKQFTYRSFQSFLSSFKAVDDMYNVVPIHLHDKYFLHFKDIVKKHLIKICPITGKATVEYLPIIIHAIKN